MSRKSGSKKSSDHRSALPSGKSFVLQSEGSFTEQELKNLRTLVDVQSQEASVVGRDGGNETYGDSARRTRVLTIEKKQEPWLFQRFKEALKAANSLYRFEGEVIGEIQLLRYDASEQGHFEWHIDISPGLMFRKVSFSVPLNDPKEYSGGALEFSWGNATYSPVQRAGKIIAFPSFLMHRVTPVTQGSRYAMVAWAHGPDWR